ncbi:neuropeptide CCHamide-1 isoform X1 [Papilio machaon]|uniref:neuropeptide CCHamide-1 isoform X1 n=1 Tax=Papilio machaon TaxID=76193 RepID=UPI001E6635DF|nr:neuropeptide CCHamide-1 isoform X1 [Papilio machaon]
MTSSRMHGKSSSGITALLVLLVVVCLVQSATEQRINRGSKSASLIEKVNGWRSQRGGSCLSYGHSCWGAHGKRSGKSLSSAPDWYLTRILRSMAANTEMDRSRHDEAKNAELNDILRMEVTGDVSPINTQMFENGDSPVMVRSRNLEAKPMLDDNVLANMKMWQLLRQTSEDK